MARRPGEGPARLYEAARQFADEALRRDGSIFTPGRSIWTTATIDDLDGRFVRRPDTSGDSFEVKFLRQLAGAPDETIQLAGEVLYVHLLITTQLKGSTKQTLIQRILQSAAQPVTVPAPLAAALEKGLCNAGRGFLQQRHSILAFLVAFAQAWKRQTSVEAATVLQEAWAFKRFVMSVAGPQARAQRYALLHLVHPDTFEPIVSDVHKSLIVDRFRSMVATADEDVDRQLVDVRAGLAAEHGPTFSFYEPTLKREWLPKTVDEDAADVVAPDTQAPGVRCWIEKTLVAGRPDREQGPDALGQALWSPQRSEDGREYYRSMQEVQPNDVVLHFADNRRFVGVSRAATSVDDTHTGLAGTPWAGRPTFRIGLRDFVGLEPPLERDAIFQDPELRRRLLEIHKTHRGLFFNRDLELNQGAYLTEAPAPLVSLLSEVYETRTGRPLPYLEAFAVPRSTVPHSALTLSWLSDQTLWPPERLQEIIDALGRTPQIVLAGPPGTGKTWIAQLLAQYLTEGHPQRQRLVQFHPSYTYEMFMEGLRPTLERGAVQFKPVDGVVPAMAKAMGTSEVTHVLIVDEMNRANLPKVLGELMYLFEYRDQAVDLPFTKSFRLPPNLWFIGTMNTADRSIRTIDIALRRRFDIFECPPDLDVLHRYYETHENRIPSLIEGLAQLNAELTLALDRHHTIGHTFLMAHPMTAERLLHVWRHKIGPLLEEYFFDRPDEAAKMDPARFWPELRA